VLGLVNPLNDVFFLDAQTGWAVGERGTILHTDDGGDTWQRQVSPVNGDLRRIVFLDVQTGWIAGAPQWLGGWDKNVLLRTDDGGRTWTECPLPISTDSQNIDFTWADAHTGWLIIGVWVLHTADGGQTWQKQILPFDDHRLNSITSVDSQHAWIAAGNTILRTSNGGETWVALDTDLDFDAQLVVFVDIQTGWAFGEHGTIVHTSDGGQTWQTQQTQIHLIQDVDFPDASTGWVLSRSRLWSTTDGGLTWEAHDILDEKRALVFVDDQHGWVVGTGSWNWRMSGRRNSITYTEDGGATWQVQDLHIEMPLLAYTSAARLSTYLTQHDPPLEALLARLFYAPCDLWKQDWMESALGNLGWDDVSWGDPPATPESSFAYIQRLETDLDGDEEIEIILYGDMAYELFVVVWDWDGIQWQVAWFDNFLASHGGEIQVHTNDFNADEHVELLVEVMTAGHTGYFRDIVLAQCSHLSCQAVWESVFGSDSVTGGFYEGYTYHHWSGSDYRFVDLEGDAQLEIELQRYGMSCKMAEGEMGIDIPGTLEAEVMTTTQTIYRWDGTQYTPTAETILEPGYVLDTSTVTETIDLDDDGTLERIVSYWERDYWALQQILSFYIYDDQGVWQSTQAFTATVLNPSAGVSLQDMDGDGQAEVLQCTSPSYPSVTLDTWPSRAEPTCTSYRWNPNKCVFVPNTTQTSVH
jgi:photosystem II stability/assembly factor-like uncharacterized protein